MFGSLMHLAFDAALLSMVLSGVRRGSGIGLDLNVFPADFRHFIRAYLEVGEWSMDFLTVVLGRSNYFTRSLK
ncbi:hypothetical protein IE81DRAFT_319257 [Ceraceosorus guamensis]|uniref:DUF1748-domain-containing protein n=1 Tax=Ceraceosorus guamensis TaxID=1522189 RepID=A0A316WCK6_9BASI|nr:hypothetical protein IE81DRAFT_319257 [Ceraceosorus guamensis]PWN46351.1 hypothetical protein IE81DRAFT_319257 [Ceraceosorus guamensis]